MIYDSSFTRRIAPSYFPKRKKHIRVHTFNNIGEKRQVISEKKIGRIRCKRRNRLTLALCTSLFGGVFWGVFNFRAAGRTDAIILANNTRLINR